MEQNKYISLKLLSFKDPLEYCGGKKYGRNDVEDLIKKLDDECNSDNNSVESDECY